MEKSTGEKTIKLELYLTADLNTNSADDLTNQI